MILQNHGSMPSESLLDARDQPSGLGLSTSPLTGSIGYTDSTDLQPREQKESRGLPTPVTRIGR